MMGLRRDARLRAAAFLPVLFFAGFRVFFMAGS